MKKCIQLEQYLFLKDDEMDPIERDLLSHHLKSCKSCMDQRQMFLKGQDLVLRSFGRISDSGSDLVFLPPRNNHSDKTGKKKIHQMLIWTRRISTTAAILLMMIFISEQVRTVSSIQQLEKKIHQISSSPAEKIIDRWTLYQSLDTVQHPKILGMTLIRHQGDEDRKQAVTKSSTSSPFEIIFSRKNHPKKQ